MNGMTFELDTPHGRMMATMLAGIAQVERDLLSERVKSGLAAARARGKKLGRQSGQRPKSDKLAPKVLQTIEDGRSYRWVARHLEKHRLRHRQTATPKCLVIRSCTLPQTARPNEDLARRFVEQCRRTQTILSGVPPHHIARLRQQHSRHHFKKPICAIVTTQWPNSASIIPSRPRQGNSSSPLHNQLSIALVIFPLCCPQ